MKRSQNPQVMQVNNSLETNNNEPGAMESGVSKQRFRTKKKEKTENENNRNLDTDPNNGENKGSATSLYNYIVNGFAFKNTAY